MTRSKMNFMKTMVGKIAVALLCASFECLGQGTFQTKVITFDGPPAQPPGTAQLVSIYEELGVVFTQFRQVGTNTAASVFTRNGGAISDFPENGTAYVQVSASTDTLVCQFSDGSLFDVISLDLAEYSTAFQQPVTVQLVGYWPSGVSARRTYTTDGVIDGTGPLADFQTFYSQTFFGVNRLEITGDTFSLDNLTVGVVPEPASGALILAGGLVFWLVRRRNSAQTPL